VLRVRRLLVVEVGDESALAPLLVVVVCSINVYHRCS